MVLTEVFQTGLELGAGVPGLPIVFKALEAIYTLASSYRVCVEESSRLMSYCTVMATALTRFRVRDTPKLRAALTAAAEALEELRTMIERHVSQSNAALIFTSAHFKSASEKMKNNVESAVRMAMDEAQFLLMEDTANIREDLAKTKKDVALLLERRYVHAACRSTCANLSINLTCAPARPPCIRV